MAQRRKSLQIRTTNRFSHATSFFFAATIIFAFGVFLFYSNTAWASTSSQTAVVVDGPLVVYATAEDTETNKCELEKTYNEGAIIAVAEAAEDGWYVASAKLKTGSTATVYIPATSMAIYSPTFTGSSNGVIKSATEAYVSPSTTATSTEIEYAPGTLITFASFNSSFYVASRDGKTIYIPKANVVKRSKTGSGIRYRTLSDTKAYLYSGTSASSVKTFAAGTVLRVLPWSANWYITVAKVDGSLQYVFLKKSDVETLKLIVLTTSENGLVFRKSPSDSAAKVSTTVTRGAVLEGKFYGTNSSGESWYSVSILGSTCYVNSRFVEEYGNLVVDISQYNNITNWDLFASVTGLAIARNSSIISAYTEHSSMYTNGYENTGEDDEYGAFVKKFEQYNIPYGTYSYCWFNTESEAKGNARKTYEIVKQYSYRPTFVALDLELSTSSATAATWNKLACAWADAMHSYGFKKVGLYASWSFVRTGSSVLTDETLSHFDFLWIPIYSNTQSSGLAYGEFKRSASEPSRADLWQYTSKFLLPGTTSGCYDVSVVRTDGINNRSYSWYLN